jgi:hypothetical protein
VTDTAATIAHALKGRVRLRVPALRGRREASLLVAQRFATESDADRVIVRPRTGSVIVERASPPLDAEDLARRLTQLLAEHAAEVGARTEESAAARGTGLARALVDLTRNVNEDVRAALGGHADLGSLVPAALFVTSVAQVSLSGKLPAVPWYSLVWYGLRTFVTFNARALRAPEAGAPSRTG